MIKKIDFSPVNKIIKFSVVGLLSLTASVYLSVSASTTSDSDTKTPETQNHQMGTYISGELSVALQHSSVFKSSTASSNGVANVGTTDNLSDASTQASAPSDLTSTDSTLPRKDAVDISSYQSWMTQADFNQMKSQGVKTIVIKLTEGTYYKNPYAASQIKMAKAAGLNIATYHFSIFGSTSNQTTANNAAVNEANYYAAQAKALGLSTATVMINDAEYTGTSTSVWNGASQSFTNRLKVLGYANVRQYTSQNWANSGFVKPATFGAKNMWIAQYLYGKPSASNLQNTQYGAWQYTSQMYFTNFSAKKPVDTSIDYNNTLMTPNLPAITVKPVILPTKNPTTAPFKDISNSIFQKDINWIYSVGVTTGKSPTIYDPLAKVTRGEMAAFLYRLAGSPSYTPPYNIYTDISQFKNQILWLSAANVTNGTAPHYTPNGNVTRGQMAAFLHRMAKAMGKAPTSGTYTSSFTDIKNNMFKNDINWLKTTGITTGYTPTSFKPNNTVTREEMAAFLHRFYNKFKP
ncbi:MAG: S-layer homology domain-containing protein [Streptococcaceae bacterium]|nr:S-layer homology domain-containing protein [Streptococcaceae bacterium]